MKTKFLLVFLLIYNVVNSQDFLSGKVTYTTSISFDTINIAKKYKKQQDYEIIKEATLNVLKSARPQSYFLTFNKNQSLFIKENLLENESEKQINLIEIVGGKGKFYVDKLENNILHQNEFMGELFLVQCEAIKWELTQESKNIGDYLCYKAKAIKIIENKKGVFEKPIIAWYSPELPFNFGPKGYCGLPGLILELKEGKLTFSTVKIELNSKESIKIKRLDKGRKITEVEYNKIAKEAAIDIFGRN